MKVRDFFLSLRIIHGALVMGLLLFSGVAYFLQMNEGMGEPDPELGQTFLILSAVLGVSAIVGGGYFYRKFMGQAENKPSLGKKLAVYRIGNITRYAMVEGVALLAIVGYLLTGEFNLLIVGGALIIWMATLAPSIPRAGNDLPLTSEEERQLADLDTPLT